MLVLNASDDQEIDEVLTEFEAKAFSVRQQRRKVYEGVTVAELADSAYARYKQVYERTNRSNSS